MPAALEPNDVAAFLTDPRTFRHRSIVLLMLLGGLRAPEVRSLRLADVDMGLRRVRVTGKGGKERIVPVDGGFFAELAGYLRGERPAQYARPATLANRDPHVCGGQRSLVDWWRPLRDALKVSSLDRGRFDMSRKVPNWIDLRPVRATALDARGPGLRGPTAMGAFALGAAAFGAVTIGRLAIGRAAIKRLVIEELEVGRLRVRELEVDTERRSQQS